MWLQIILWASGESFLTTNNPTGRKWHSLCRASSNLLASCCSLLKYFTVCNPTPEIRYYWYKGLGPLLPYTCALPYNLFPILQRWVKKRRWRQVATHLIVDERVSCSGACCIICFVHVLPELCSPLHAMHVP
jgi:hypothetical protein